MNLRRSFRYFFAFTALMLLILDGKTALASGQEAVMLCAQSVIPALFPFMFLTTLLQGRNGLVPFIHLLGIPEGAEPILVAGYLGGYPAGARIIGEYLRTGKLNKGCAKYLLRFCCNAGPSFFFGIAAQQFPQWKYPMGLWMIHIASSLLILVMQPPVDCFFTKNIDNTISIPDALHRTVSVTGIICGWIILFRILLGFLQRWLLFLFPIWLQVLLCGILELTNGCCNLSMIPALPLRFVIASAILGFGGLCVTMQTGSVIHDIPLSFYVLCKLRHCFFSVLLALIWLRKEWAFYAVSILCLITLFLKNKKRSSIPLTSGV